ARGRYRKWPAYAQSKLANLLFTFELQRRADAVGVELLALSAHPGYAATDPAVRGGEVFGPDGFLELRGAPKRVAVSSRARDRAVAERLWEVSEEKTGVRYPALDPA